MFFFYVQSNNCFFYVLRNHNNYEFISNKVCEFLFEFLLGQTFSIGPSYRKTFLFRFIVKSLNSCIIIIII